MTFSVSDLWWIVPLLVWELIWKGLALWRAAERKEGAWFVALLVLNTVGILPIAYIVFHNKASH